MIFTRKPTRLQLPDGVVAIKTSYNLFPSPWLDNKRYWLEKVTFVVRWKEPKTYPHFHVPLIFYGTWVPIRVATDDDLRQLSTVKMLKNMYHVSKL